ncbi:MAG: hypothetical protein GXP62_05065 [Oligoflexia bacterium]|nr:hypothetical protein [Oligoflexia bacterium]
MERLNTAFSKVAANKGAPGPDRQTIGDVRKRWPRLEAVLRLLRCTTHPLSRVET